MTRRQLFAAALGSVVPAIPKPETYEIEIKIDHVDNFDDFIRKIERNHNGAAEALARRIKDKL